MSSDLLRAHQGLIVGNRLHSLLPERLESRGVFTQIELGSDEDNGNVRRMMIDLGVPLMICQLIVLVCRCLAAGVDHVPWP